LIKFSKG